MPVDVTCRGGGAVSMFGGTSLTIETCERATSLAHIRRGGDAK
jgi:hypothetical protein